jgi:hypothetical protein
VDPLDLRRQPVDALGVAIVGLVVGALALLPEPCRRAKGLP